MREHDAAARRMVVGGAVVLAAALGAVGVAAAVAVSLDREAAREESRRRLQEAVDKPWAMLGVGGPDHTTVRTDVAFRLASGRGHRPFDPAPPVEDRAARFWLGAAEHAESPALARAALLLARDSGDDGARLAAAYRLGDLESVPSRLRETREAVALGLAAGDPDARERAWSAVGTEDDLDAAALLVGHAGDDLEEVLQGLRRRRRHADDERVVLRVAPTLPVRVLRNSGGKACRAALLEDGTSVYGEVHEDGWIFQRNEAAWTARELENWLGPAGVRLVGPEVTLDADTVAVPVPFGRRAVWTDGGVPRSRRPTLLLAGLGVVAAGSVAAYAAFVRAVRREARAAAARADFVATVSHELRTPVAVVRTSAETLLADRAPRDEDRRTLLGAILRESERLSGLLGNVLDFARIDAGTRRYAFREVAVRDLVEETVRRTAPTLAAGGFRADVVVSDDAGVLHADPDALGAALANLLDNAAKFRGAGELATVRVTGDAAEVTIDLEDHGFGVPDAEKPHVFERFFRGSDPRVRETRGSGIGLALVRHAIEAHGGRVTVRDTPGGGATFRIVLPRRGRD